MKDIASPAAAYAILEAKCCGMLYFLWGKHQRHLYMVVAEYFYSVIVDKRSKVAVDNWSKCLKAISHYRFLAAKIAVMITPMMITA